MPALDRFQLFLSVFVHATWTGFMLDGRLNPEFLQNVSGCWRIRHAVMLPAFICFEPNFSKFSGVRLEGLARDGEKRFPHDVFLGLPHLSFEHLRRDSGFIDIKECDVAETYLMQDDDELHEIRVRLLPERFLALPK